jgi:hypothetical protein
MSEENSLQYIYNFIQSAKNNELVNLKTLVHTVTPY